MKRRPPPLDKPYRRHRPLTVEEEQLWLEEVGEAEKRQVLPPPEGGRVAVGVKPGTLAEDKSHLNPPPSKMRKKEAEPQPVDAHTRKKILRGKVKVEATLDLHGHHRPAAHAELIRFIERAQAKEASLVLVITGKGKNGKPGILREELPRWLSTPPLREAIIAYDTAGPAHGGEGAWYLRIRKKR